MTSFHKGFFRNTPSERGWREISPFMIRETGTSIRTHRRGHQVARLPVIVETSEIRHHTVFKVSGSKRVRGSIWNTPEPKSIPWNHRRTGTQCRDCLTVHGGSEHSSDIMILDILSISQCIFIRPPIPLFKTKITIWMFGRIARISPIGVSVIKCFTPILTPSICKSCFKCQIFQNIPWQIGIQIQLTTTCLLIHILNGFQRIIRIVGILCQQSVFRLFGIGIKYGPVSQYLIQKILCATGIRSLRWCCTLRYIVSKIQASAKFHFLSDLLV